MNVLKNILGNKNDSLKKEDDLMKDLSQDIKEDNKSIDLKQKKCRFKLIIII